MPSPLTCLLMLSAAAIAQPPALPDPDPHAEDRMVRQMDAAAPVVWANGEVSRSPAEILAYYDRMVKGSDRILTKYTTAAKLHEHARFLGSGELATADGAMEDEFTPIIRGPFRLSGKWTTTAAKINGEWKVISLHLSANVLLAEALPGWFLGHLK